MKNIFNRLFSKSNQKVPNDRNLPNTNSIQMLGIYRTTMTWAFDDPRVGLVREPFVCGIETIIDDTFLTKTGKKPRPGDTAQLLFSENSFPGHDLVLEWESSQDGGNWYTVEGTDQRGWLCPALYHYFSVAPRKLYVCLK
jgi:hypothetical protein